MSPEDSDALLAATPGAVGAVTALLERVRVYGGSVCEETDLLLRGLMWLAARDPADETTALLARVAVAAGSAPGRPSSQVCAPRTATAAVEILVDRPGDPPVRALARLASVVRSMPLRYVGHPVTGAVARRLIWQTSADGRSWRAGVPCREVYPLTPAERVSRTSSARFTGHILRYRQAAALLRTRAGRRAIWAPGIRATAQKR
jgi:hypothetical protein